MKNGLRRVVWLILGSVTGLLGQTTELRGDLENRFQDLDQAPDHRLVDLGEVFYRNQSLRDQLADRFEKLAKEHHFSVYFVTYSGLIGSDVGEKAEIFRDNWLGTETEGLVLVCDTDTKTTSFALTKVDGLPADQPHPSWRLSDNEVVDVMRLMTKLSSPSNNKEDYLALVGNSLVDELTKKLEKKKKRPPPRGQGLVLTFITTASLIMIAVWWLQRRARDSTQSGLITFPSISVPTRLGASFGGGQTAEILFKKPPTEH